MPIFKVDKNKTKKFRGSNFRNNKDLQSLRLSFILLKKY
jgi:hypothetical protein